MGKATRNEAMMELAKTVADEKTREYIIKRLLPLMQWYADEASKHMRLYRSWSVASLAASASIPVVSLFSSSGLHFFCEDYIFDNVWNQPTKYIDIFKPFKYVVQPDFSLYYNFPVALQIFNKYRNHWLGNFFSFYGISVIPNINVSSPERAEAPKLE